MEAGEAKTPASPKPAVKIVKTKKRDDRWFGCHPLIIIIILIWLTVHITLVVWYWEGGTKLVDPDE
jgi:hypothetical protein